MAITVQDLLEAGCHFGHQTKRWNPKMKDYVFGTRNGISIIDLTKTIRQIGEACNFLQRKVVNGANILFVGTKRQAQPIVKEIAEATGMYYVAERWLGGTLTNIKTIKKSVQKMAEYDEIISQGTASGLKKKEISLLQRKVAKLHKDLDGIKDMRGLPDVVVIIDICHDDNAVKEACKLSIPVVAIVDTNSNPEPIDYPVAANDDAVKSIEIIMNVFSEAVKDAAALFQQKEADRKAKEASEKDAMKKRESADRAARKERMNGRKAEEGKADAKAAGAKKSSTSTKKVDNLKDLKKSDIKPAEEAPKA